MMNLRFGTPRQPNQPNIQSFRYFEPRGPYPRWRPAFTQADVQATQQLPPIDTDKLHLVSCDIDFSTPSPTEPMTEALKYLKNNKTELTHSNLLPRNGLLRPGAPPRSFLDTNHFSLVADFKIVPYDST